MNIVFKLGLLTKSAQASTYFPGILTRWIKATTESSVSGHTLNKNMKSYTDWKAILVSVYDREVQKNTENR